MPVYSACGPGHLGASQTYIGPPVDRPLSDSLPCSVSESEPQFPVTGFGFGPTSAEALAGFGLGRGRQGDESP